MNPRLAAYWEERKRLVDQTLDELLPREGRLAEAVRYSVFAGGKRLRPILAIMGYELAGGEDLEHVLPVAAALEMIHTFSLIHDDLPAIDNDDFRRGKPSSHKAFGEALAILAGDALLAHAFRVLAEAPLQPPVKVRVLQEITQAIGFGGVIDGETADVLAEKEAWEPTEELVRYIHSRKTGALIRGSLVSGAIAAGAEELEPFRRVGEGLGLLFQITDDILDVVGDPQKLGKAVRKDDAKCTWVRVFGLERAKEDAERMAEELKRAAREAWGSRAERLVDLIDFVLTRTY